MARRASKSEDAKAARPLVTVLGVGQMGLVCAGLLVAPDAGRDGGQGLARPVRVHMWGHDRDEAGEVAQTRGSPRLEGFVLSDEVEVVLSDARAVGGASLIVSAIPVQYIRETWVRLAPHIPKDAAVLSVA